MSDRNAAMNAAPAPAAPTPSDNVGDTAGVKFLLVAPAGVAAAFTVGWAVTRSAFVARFL
jgi:hypothetical protein